MDIELYKAGLEECWNDEKYGEVLFGAMARMARQDGHEDLAVKLDKLEALEASVHEALKVLAQKYNLVRRDDDMVEQGQARADEVWPWGWQKIMEEFAEDAVGDLARMQELLKIAPEDDRSALQFLVDHEAALKAFMDAEVLGEERSIKFIEELIL